MLSRIGCRSRKVERGRYGPGARSHTRYEFQENQMAIVEVKVPQFSESVSEGTMLQWKKKAGEAVARGCGEACGTRARRYRGQRHSDVDGAQARDAVRAHRICAK